VRASPVPLARFSPEMATRERRLKAFLYARLYHHAAQRETAGRARAVIAGLFAAYAADPALLSPVWRERLPQDEPARARHIADFIAGMTDRYAIDRYTQLFGEVPAGLSQV
jgi:dGTPase